MGSGGVDNDLSHLTRSRVEVHLSLRAGPHLFGNCQIAKCRVPMHGRFSVLRCVRGRSLQWCCEALPLRESKFCFPTRDAMFGPVDRATAAEVCPRQCAHLDKRGSTTTNGCSMSSRKDAIARGRALTGNWRLGGRCCGLLTARCVALNATAAELGHEIVNKLPDEIRPTSTPQNNCPITLADAVGLAGPVPASIALSLHPISRKRLNTLPHHLPPSIPQHSAHAFSPTSAQFPSIRPIPPLLIVHVLTPHPSSTLAITFTTALRGLHNHGRRSSSTTASPWCKSKDDRR